MILSLFLNNTDCYKVLLLAQVVKILLLSTLNIIDGIWGKYRFLTLFKNKAAI